MSNLSLKSIIREEIILEYSTKVIAMLQKKFKKEKPSLTDAQIQYYLDGFDRVKSSPKVTEKDINKYTFAQLEKTVDFFPKKTTVNKDINTAQVKGEEVYEKDGIEIYLGDSRDKCVKYRKAFQGDTGQAYSWCIARSDASNLYGGYRYGDGDGGARIFYFVIDRNKPITDPLHVFVVHVYDAGKYGLTNALNNDDKNNLDWAALVSLAPALRGVPQTVFKPQPLTQAEKDRYKLSQLTVTHTNDLFAHFGSYDLVRDYIELHQHQLITGQLKTLLEQKQYDLINLYINIGHSIPLDVIKLFPKELLYNYARVGKQLLENSSTIQTTRAALMYIYKFIDEKQFVKKILKPLKSIEGSNIGFIASLNRPDALELIFTNAFVYHFDSFDEKTYDLYLRCGKQYFYNRKELDPDRARAMLERNIDTDISHS